MVNGELFRLVAQILSSPVTESKQMTGGMINNVHRLTMADGRQVIAKQYNNLSFGDAAGSGACRGAIEDRILRLLPTILPESARTLVTVPESLGVVRGNDGSVLGIQRYLPHEENLETFLSRGSCKVERNAAPGEQRIGTRLGAWLGALHRIDAPQAREISNSGVQETRKAVQYDRTASVLSDLRSRLSQRGGLPEVEVSRLMEETGGHFLLSGRCLTMGDAWPRSFLIDPRGGIGAIDWEFSHFGSPVQDIAHLLTHFWMVGLAGGKGRWQRAERLAEAVARSYQRSLRQAEEGDLLSYFAPETAYLYLHGAAELIMRLGGAYAAGYVLEGVPDEIHAHALRKVEDLLLSGSKALDRRPQEFSITPFFRIMFP